MSKDKSFQQRYEDQETPWEIHRPDRNLVEIITSRAIPPGRVIDIGCGTGDNAIWFARHGFTATACDASPLAVSRAGEKAAGVENCAFHTFDFLEVDTVAGAPFDLAFDRGCFHTIEAGEARGRFVERVAAILKERGLWLSLIGNADGESREEGPPRLTAAEITAAVEPHFEILSLTSDWFDSDMERPPRCWRCLAQKR